MPDLTEFAANVYSQYGEDGVIERMLEVIEDTNGWCVEFGAWDGLHLSNCANLVHNKGYAAVFIEANPEKFSELQATYRDCPRVTTINAFVGFTPTDGLDTILSTIEMPDDPDLLSIDIDGNDYHVWAAVERLRPKIVCIEFNPTVPNDVAFVQAADPRVQRGSGVAALVRLGREKRYELVCCTDANAFFVDDRYFPRMEINDNSLESLRRDRSHLTYSVLRLRRPHLPERVSANPMASDPHRGIPSATTSLMVAALPR
jgi:hypothetical protein